MLVYWVGSTHQKWINMVVFSEPVLPVDVVVHSLDLWWSGGSIPKKRPNEWGNDHQFRSYFGVNSRVPCTVPSGFSPTSTCSVTPTVVANLCTGVSGVSCKFRYVLGALIHTDWTTSAWHIVVLHTSAIYDLWSLACSCDTPVTLLNKTLHDLPESQDALEYSPLAGQHRSSEPASASRCRFQVHLNIWVVRVFKWGAKKI